MRVVCIPFGYESIISNIGIDTKSILWRCGNMNEQSNTITLMLSGFVIIILIYILGLQYVIPEIRSVVENYMESRILWGILWVPAFARMTKN